MALNLYVLFGSDASVDEQDAACRGVYCSEDELRNGVNHWINIRPQDTLHFQEWEVDYPSEPFSWDWCYIPRGSRMKQLMSGGGSVPVSKWWGTNLVGLDGVDRVHPSDYIEGKDD